MTALSVKPPFPIFTDTAGQPLEDGFIYIGIANQDPVTNPITVYWDAALTVPATQPIRTLAGYPSRSGTPGVIYLDGDYSITVKNKNNALVYQSLSVTERVGSEFVTFIQSGSGAVQRTVESKLRETVSVKDFGAVGDGIANDTAAIQAALDYAQTVISSQTVSIFFPRGVYAIYSELTVSTAGTEIRIYGEHMRSSQIVANAGMTNMLNLGTSSGFYGRMLVENLGFDCNDLSTNGIYAQYLRYATIQNCEIRKIPSSGFGVVMARWVNRIDNNLFDGNGNGNGLLIPQETTNNFVITRNSFSNCAIGLQSDTPTHDLQIAHNAFDLCIKAGIFLTSGGRNVQIKNNYFEKCGNTTGGGGVDIPAVLGGTANYSAPIVATYNASSSATTQLENLVVSGNQFADCVNTGLMVISGVYGLTWQDNHALRQYSYAYAVRFVQRAIAEGVAATRNLLVQQNDYNSQFTELVELNPANLATTSRNNVQLIWNKGVTSNFTGPQYNILPQDVTASPWSTTAGTVTAAGTFYEGVQPIYEFSASPAGTCELVIPLDANNQTMRGRYFRISYLTRSTGTSDGVRCVIAIDSGAGYVDIANLIAQSTDWVIGARGYVFYVPTNAVNLRFRLSRGASQTCQLANLVLDAASAPVRQ